jgi:hypothetical protein
MFCRWPKLSPLKGWHQDKQQSFRENANVLAPNGSTFVGAETVMYANAVYKPRVPDSKTLDKFIAADQKSFPQTSAAELPSLLTADGQRIRVFLFSPQGAANWEKIGYGEEGDYYLVFALSSRSRSGLDQHAGDYARLVNSYRSKPL